jgi:hypothetical protein
MEAMEVRNRLCSYPFDKNWLDKCDRVYNGLMKNPDDYDIVYKKNQHKQWSLRVKHKNSDMYVGSIFRDGYEYD